MTVNAIEEFNSSSEVGKRNIEVVKEFFSLYLKDIDRFYALWVEEDPVVVTPFVVGSVDIVANARHVGWEAVRGFWDPIHLEMSGTFDWTIDDIIVGEDPNVLVVRSRSHVDVHAGPTWGNRPVQFKGQYVQIFEFENGKVKLFEEYYDTNLVAKAYS